MMNKVNSKKKSNLVPIAGLEALANSLFDGATDKDGDFATIVIGAAKLDACLGAMLQAFFIEGDTSAQLLGSSGAAGPFATRAKLCYSLGLITKSALLDLTIIAELRNHCAHTPGLTTFSDPYVIEQCGRLKWTKEWLIREESFVPGIEPMVQDPKLAFKFTSGMMYNELLKQAKKIVRRSQPIEGRSDFYVRIQDGNGKTMNPRADRPMHLLDRKQ